MLHKLTYAVMSDDTDILKQFEHRLSLVGIHVRHLKSSDKYNYLEASWDDAHNLNEPFKNSRSNAGAKPKQLMYNGTPATCGFIYRLRTEKKLSDAEIGMIFDVSESTIARRRKKHLSQGNLYEESNIIF